MSKLYNYIRSVLYGHYYFKIIYMISPKYGANMIFKRFFHRNMDLEKPCNLQEKTFWLLFNTDTSLWTKCADKYRVREYVKEKGCSEILNKLYGHWETEEEIDFDTLPNSFVLKVNNGCHSVMVVKDKSKLDVKQTKKVLHNWLKYPFGYLNSQKHYLQIKPCLIAEELLEEPASTRDLSDHSLVDYKVWCFHGKPECILLVCDRADGFTKQAVFDLNWNCISKQVFKVSDYIEDFPKPKNLEKMLDYAKILSADFQEVRVDFYNLDGRIVFGELTFTAGYGDLTDDYYEYLGSKITLPKD